MVAPVVDLCDGEPESAPTKPPQVNFDDEFMQYFQQPGEGAVCKRNARVRYYRLMQLKLLIFKLDMMIS